MASRPWTQPPRQPKTWRERLERLARDGWEPTDEQVQYALNLLTPRQAEAIVLVRLRKLSQSEAARQLGITRQVLRRHLDTGVEHWAEVLVRLAAS